MDPTLIQRITDLVMAQLGPAPAAPVAAASSQDGRKLLLIPAATSHREDPLWNRLAQLGPVHWTGVQVPGFCHRDLTWVTNWVEAPACWDRWVCSFEAIVLPVLALEHLSRLALLLGDSPVTGAALAGVVQGLPVLASAFEVDRLKRASGRLPGPFLSLFHQHLRTVEGLGIEVLEAEALCQKLHKTPQIGLSQAARGRDVVTASDLEALMRSGQKRLQVAPGSIITPLAAEKATQLGIEVVFL